VFGRMPWLEDKPESFSTSGRLWPNVTLFARVDTVHPMVVWPLSPTRARVITYTLVPKAYFGQPDFQQRAEAYREYQNKVLAEDREMLDSVQGGVQSRRYVPGPMADVEIGVKHVINSFLERLNIPASTASR
jgi:phenylpropionate dioxygenase-like ring-hydroxylating dioxygenase large terminal subunit